MAEYRRKQFYIDRIFQNKFLFLFLFLCFVGTVGNLLYLFLFLKREVEDSMYRSRIIIENVNEIMINSVVYFNAGLTIAITLLTIVFYLIIRQRVKRFLKGLGNAVNAGREPALFERHDVELPQEFQDINGVLDEFFSRVDKRNQLENKAIDLLQKFVESPDASNRKEALASLTEIEKAC